MAPSFPVDLEVLVEVEYIYTGVVQKEHTIFGTFDYLWNWRYSLHRR
jgi:hypothetical protein